MTFQALQTRIAEMGRQLDALAESMDLTSEALEQQKTNSVTDKSLIGELESQLAASQESSSRLASDLDVLHKKTEMLQSMHSSKTVEADSAAEVGCHVAWGCGRMWSMNWLLQKWTEIQAQLEDEKQALSLELSEAISTNSEWCEALNNMNSIVTPFTQQSNSLPKWLASLKR